MNRQRIYTIAGIALAVLSAFGGLFLTNLFLGRQEQQLLVAAEKIAVAAPFELSDDNLVSSEVDMEDLRTVIRAAIQFGGSNFHEPLQGQLNMKQAIRVAQELLEEFVAAGVLSDVYLPGEGYQINAELANPMTRGDTWEETDFVADFFADAFVKYEDDSWVESMLSCWYVFIDTGMMQVHCKIHAESGIIWEVSLYAYDGELDADRDNILDVYLDSIGLMEQFSTDEWINYNGDLFCGYWGDELLAYIYQGDSVVDNFGTLEQYNLYFNQEYEMQNYHIDIGLMPESTGFEEVGPDISEMEVEAMDSEDNW